jgi:predicted Fe-Mo cluster-binding NifX family protein
MRIAVASDDGTQIAEHTGRCRGFVIFEITGQDAAQVEFRKNEFTAHAHGECHGEHAQPGVDMHHSHAPLVEALSDCQVLITRGLGPRLVADLATQGIAVHVCNVAAVDEAARLYARGQLPRATSGSCCCHHQ